MKKSFLQEWNTVIFYKKTKNAFNRSSVYHAESKGITLSLELRNYMKIAHPGMDISKPGYLKQRMKLNPLAFYELYRHHNRNFYAEPGFSTFQGYIVLAADGSGINISTARETLEEFGTSSRKGTKPQASIGLGCLYDVMNRMILESDCCKCKFDEMRLAEEQIDRVRETTGDSQPFLVVMDRGYPSTAAFIRIRTFHQKPLTAGRSQNSII